MMSNPVENMIKKTVILSCALDEKTSRNNYLPWIASLIDELGPNYGRIASVLKTHQAYVIPPVVAADYTPPAEEGVPELSAAQLAGLRVDALTIRLKAVQSQVETNPKFYNAIYARIGKDSRLLIGGDADYAAADTASDPNLLLALARRTHFTHVGGAVNPAKAREDLEQIFNDLKQKPNEPVAAFKTEFDEQLRTLASAGAPAIEPDRLVLKFLRKLDQARHGPMVVQLTNTQAAGGAFPATVEAAYNLAREWTSTTKPAGKNGGTVTGAAFLLADDIRVLIAPPVRASVKPKPVQEPSSGAKAGPKKAYEEKRACHECGEVGHLRRNCPQRKVMLAVGDEPDEEALYQAAMEYGLAAMCKCEVSGPLEERIMFSPTELVLDNAADRSLFENPSLLHNIMKRDSPVLIGGVARDGTSIRVDDEGQFADLCVAGVARDGAANLVSQAQLVDEGRTVRYIHEEDRYDIEGTERVYSFTRRLRSDGSKSRFYTCELALVAAVDENLRRALVATVAENLRRFSKRDAKYMDNAVQLMQRLGHMGSGATIKLLNAGVLNCSVTATDVRNKDAAMGVSIPGLMGKTKKQKSVSAGYVLAPRVTQVQQILHVDIIFVKKIPFLLGVFTPLDLTMIEFLRDRGVECVGQALHLFIALAKGRGFDVLEVRCDGEGAVGALSTELNLQGIKVFIAGPGQHVHVVERKSQTVKSRHRCHELSLPFVMTKLLIIWCMKFCTHCVNLQASANATDTVCPYEQFSGIKLDAKRDLRVAFGDFVMATPAETNNSMEPRSEPFIALGGKHNLTGSVWMLSLKTGKIVSRDQFTHVPMPSNVVDRITAQALRQGYVRGAEPVTDLPVAIDDDDEDVGPPLPDMMAIDGRADAMVPEVPAAEDTGADLADAPAAGVMMPPPVHQDAPDVATEAQAMQEPLHLPTLPAATGLTEQDHEIFRDYGVRWSQRSRAREPEVVLLTRLKNDADRAEIRRQLLLRSHWRDPEFAFKISVRAALRERGEEARTVILAELQQMVDKKVWHGIHLRNLTSEQRRAIIRSSMFLRDKFLASGAFEKYKARLVAGGDQQDHDLYENLSSPTAATTSVFTIAAIAAAEGRHVMTMDIGGAFLNADITATGVKVHMRLDKLMTELLVKISPEHAQFVEPSGCSVVELDKALYGCIEAAALWFTDLDRTLKRDGFTPNCYDPCVYNKFAADGRQITAAVHVDDLKVTSASESALADFEEYMRSSYAEVKVCRGKVIHYLGMTFDYTVPGQVAITMDGFIQDVLAECGVSPPRSTPACGTLFDTRDAPKGSAADVKHFRTFVAKMLYLSKRVRPECLTPVSFLSTRVHEVDIDDVAKLRRLLGYLRATPNRGIILRIGEHMSVRAYIDAAYGVHGASGKSHTGCAIVLGDAGALSVRSCKQKIVTKSSTEAELVGLSDSAAQAIHLRNFVIEQGYELGPVIIYQDNLSAMALMKRGGPGSERSRHISIRHFWIAERVADGEVVIEHLSTEKMHANVLTKPVQGSQFLQEREGLTNWR